MAFSAFGTPDADIFLGKSEASPEPSYSFPQRRGITPYLKLIGEEDKRVSNCFQDLPRKKNRQLLLIIKLSSIAKRCASKNCYGLSNFDE